MELVKTERIVIYNHHIKCQLLLIYGSKDNVYYDSIQLAQIKDSGEDLKLFNLKWRCIINIKRQDSEQILLKDCEITNEIMEHVIMGAYKFFNLPTDQQFAAYLCFKNKLHDFYFKLFPNQSHQITAMNLQC